MAGKIIIISAPSGCGKSTIINAILEQGDIDMKFSISATNRPPRMGEVDGVNYFFLSDEEFRCKIVEDAFVEYEEVYPGRFYGTLKSEVERICNDGHNVILDIDVKGGVSVKQLYGDRAISIFVMPPSIEELRRRLESRGTETPELIDQRIGKAEYEISFAPQYDCSIVNDKLDDAIAQMREKIMAFISR